MAPCNSLTVDYPSNLASDIFLPNRQRVRIRALHRCEDKPVRDLYARLSPTTRYLRFFSPVQEVPESVVRLLSCVDYCRSLALIAEADVSGRPETVHAL